MGIVIKVVGGLSRCEANGKHRLLSLTKYNITPGVVSSLLSFRSQVRVRTEEVQQVLDSCCNH